MHSFTPFSILRPFCLYGLSDPGDTARPVCLCLVPSWPDCRLRATKVPS
jgi:hypothetical protein